MCAIAGVVVDKCIASLQEIVQQMLQVMQKRGPDSTHFYANENTKNNFFGGMNRLSINDMENGEQPFFNKDKSIIVLFNGEIYNYLELKQELQCDGVEFSSNCDGEILPYLYDKYGTEFFARLDGMFGICIYDNRNHKIILGRDIIGEKPLYYCKDKSGFYFATLTKALKSVCQVSLNYKAIWDFLTFGFVVEPMSVYNEIYALPKGSFLSLDCSSLEYTITSFKKVCLEFFKEDSKDLIEHTKEIITKNIYDRLLSDVGVGAFLSGGLDSSIVVALASEKIRNLKTFNIAFLDDCDPYCGFANESRFAKIVAERFGVEHYEIGVGAKDYQQELMQFIENIDMPFGAVSGIGVYIVAKKANALGLKVLLSGDGADEYFGGYGWYPKLRFNNMQYITEEKPKGWHYYAFESEKRAILSKDLFANNLDSRIYFPKIDSNPLEFINFDRDIYLSGEMMVKLDRMCMGASVEGRACFVSPRIASFTQNIPYDVLLKNGEKWLLKEAFNGILPKEILTREKHGFNAPIDYWIKNDWRWLLQEVFSANSALNKLGILESGVEKYFINLLDRNDRRIGNVAFYLIVLNLWLQEEIL